MTERLSDDALRALSNAGTQGPWSCALCFGENHTPANYELIDAAVNDLRARLASPAPEPVAWMVRGPDCDILFRHAEKNWAAKDAHRFGEQIIPLYAHPPRPDDGPADAPAPDAAFDAFVAACETPKEPSPHLVEMFAKHGKHPAAQIDREQAGTWSECDRCGGTGALGHPAGGVVTCGRCLGDGKVMRPLPSPPGTPPQPDKDARIAELKAATEHLNAAIEIAIEKGDVEGWDWLDSWREGERPAMQAVERRIRRDRATAALSRADVTGGGE